MHIRAVFFVLLFTAVASFAQTHIVNTPLQPVAIHRSGTSVYVLTARTDVDFDDTLDVGDVPAALVKCDLAGTVLQTLTFPWSNVNAARSFLDTTFNEYYVIMDDSIVVVDCSTMTKRFTMWHDGASAVSLMPDADFAFISQRPNYTDPGEVKILRTLSKSVVKTLPAGVNVQMTSWYTTSTGTRGLIVVNEGGFGADNGSVDIWVVEDTTWTKSASIHGGLPNHVYVVGDAAYATMNTGHEVLRIDLTTGKVVASYKTGTTEYDGPRESIVVGPYLMTSTFHADVRVFNLATTDLLQTIDVDAKPEGLLAADARLWVTRAFKKGLYDADSGVVIMDLPTPTSVQDDGSSARATAWPNPVSSVLVVRGLGTDLARLRCTSALGTDVAITDHLHRGANDSIVFDVSAMPNGIYMLTGPSASVKFVVSR